MTGSDLYELKDFANAFKRLTLEANNGNVKSKYLLGQCYFQGYGVNQDKQVAFSLYKEAALQNYPDAQADVAYCLLNGEGCAKDYRDAFVWATRAANNGASSGYVALGIIYENGLVGAANLDSAFAAYYMGAKLRDANALFNVGVYYLTGKGSVTEDKTKAVEYFKQAAEFGHPNACFNLGMMYYYGDGVERSSFGAYAYLSQAQRCGHPSATEFISKVYNSKK